MMNEVGELTEKNKVFVAVCEAAVKPETFEYAKWKGIGRPPVDHMAVYKAFLFKAVHDVPTTKEMIERLMLEPQSRRLCGWIWPEDVPCEAKFSEVNKEFSQMGFTDEWFGDFVKTFVGTEGRMSVCYDSAPVPVRAKAANRKRVLSELEPDQPEPGSRLEWQAGQDADTALEELPQDCDWGTKRDAHGKPRHWKGGKIHAAVTDDGIPAHVAAAQAKCPNVKLRIVVGEAGPGEHDFDKEMAAFGDEFARPATMTDDEYTNIVAQTMTKITQRTASAESGAVRAGFAGLMFIRAAGTASDATTDAVVSSLPSDVQGDAKSSWFPSALAESPSYDPMLAPAQAGDEPNPQVVLDIAAPQQVDSMLGDLQAGKTDPGETAGQGTGVPGSSDPASASDPQNNSLSGAPRDRVQDPQSSYYKGKNRGSGTGESGSTSEPSDESEPTTEPDTYEGQII